MPTEAQKKANAKYKATHVKKINLSLNKKTDADIIERLNSVDNVNGFIKKLIREEIAKNR